MLNKKSLGYLKKNLKINSKYIKIDKLYSSYVKKDNGEIIYSEKKLFDTLEEEVQELYLKNFKKLLTGNIDEKVFELSFITDNEEKNVQGLFLDIINSDFHDEEGIKTFISEIYKNCIYETDFIINILKCEHKRQDGHGDIEDLGDSKDFMLCSINKISPEKKSLKFDYKSKAFKQNSSMEMIIDLNSPLQGFVFPLVEESYEDVNRVIYNNGKNKAVDESFIKNVLGCNFRATSKQDKDNLDNIIKFTTKDGIKATDLKNLYEFLLERKEEEEDLVSIRDIVPFIEENTDLEYEDMVRMSEKLLGDKDYKFKGENLLPDVNSKSIKIENKDICINMNPMYLDNLIQTVDKDGNRFIKIKIDEKAYINDIEIKDEILE